MFQLKSVIKNDVIVIRNDVIVIRNDVIVIRNDDRSIIWLTTVFPRKIHNTIKPDSLDKSSLLFFIGRAYLYLE